VGRSDIQRIFLELRQVNILTTSSSATQKSITQSFHDHTDHMDQQYEGLTKRLDALGQLVLSGQQIAAQGSGAPPMPSDHEGNEVAKASSLRVLISQRTPCRDWCPCSCHVKQSKKMTVPGIMESLLGTMFVGYTGIPVLGKPCDFRGCTHHQSLAATIEYWFPWWFVSKNLKVQFSYLPNIGPQLQLATMRRVTDTALSVTYATQGNIDGLKTLFSEGLASPRDVSNSRGFTLLRVRLPAHDRAYLEELTRKNGSGHYTVGCINMTPSSFCLRKAHKSMKSPSRHPPRRSHPLTLG